jgi:hypothetical protein
MIANVDSGDDSRLGKVLKVAKDRNSIEPFRREFL